MEDPTLVTKKVQSNPSSNPASPTNSSGNENSNIHLQPNIGKIVEIDADLESESSEANIQIMKNKLKEETRNHSNER